MLFLWAYVKLIPLTKDMCPHSRDTQDKCLHGKDKGDAILNENEYFLVKRRALPEVLLKVVEAKRIFDAEKVMTVQEATDIVGISRSSFYKYKDDIFRFHDDVQGKTITLILGLDDVPGLFSSVLRMIAENGANILTIHQSIPINGVASVSISVQVSDNVNATGMIDEMEQQNGVRYVKILARE